MAPYALVAFGGRDVRPPNDNLKRPRSELEGGRLVRLSRNDAVGKTPPIGMCLVENEINTIMDTRPHHQSMTVPSAFILQHSLFEIRNSKFKWPTALENIEYRTRNSEL